MKSTNSVAEVIATPTYSQLETKGLKPIGNSSIVRGRAVDTALERTQDLIQDPNYKKWFAKQAIRIGADRYLGIAADAREGRQPQRLFVYLLKKA